MSKIEDVRRGRHCVFAMHVHLVFVTKYRRKVFTKATLAALEAMLSKVCEDFEAELVSFEGERDHVHLLVNYPPQVLISRLVNSLKGASSRRLRKEIPQTQQHYRKGVLWSPSYFASSCGGAPLEIIKQYIAGQDSPVA